jgi:modulator of FtsH protease HflK
MSWNNQGGGPWRSGQGPWGQGPGGVQPPGDLEEMLRRLQGALRGLLPGGGGFAGRGVIFVILVAILLWFAWGFYTVQPNEIGINLCSAVTPARRRRASITIGRGRLAR